MYPTVFYIFLLFLYVYNYILCVYVKKENYIIGVSLLYFTRRTFLLKYVHNNNRLGLDRPLRR